jgi:hypothetical protein
MLTPRLTASLFLTMSFGVLMGELVESYGFEGAL